MKPDYNLARLIHDLIPGNIGKASGDYGSLKFPPNVLSNESFSAPRYRNSCKFLHTVRESVVFERIPQVSCFLARQFL